MAGHSKWANIKHRKGAQDKKRGNLFTKLAKEIIVAAKSGQPDPQFNASLRNAIANAKSQSMPKDKIENALKRASGLDGENYEGMKYEGFATGGVAVIIECLTDNKNRSASEVRATLGKNGGNLGESGSVSFMFDHLGLIQYPKDAASDDDMFEAALEAGASDCESDDEMHNITCEMSDYSSVRDALAEKYGDAEAGQLIWKAQNDIAVDEATSNKVEALVEKLEDLDDVQYVYTNHVLSE